MALQRPFRLCSLAELHASEVAGFDPLAQGKDALLALICDEQVHAYLNRCPHEPVTMEYRKDKFLSGKRQHIMCFAHGARFEKDTGLCIHGPCLGKSLQRITTHIQDGDIYIDLEELIQA
ncbi:Rieske 2Fe-2S domain-containing protein [Pokkaliibacter sp. MBI-7]|uniref:Rieske (2Fe-2S) protein n=1 Tax=Pokkaliibacter sp. MBI-7 TaxID=3040600 RepID=UPI0024473EF7|nr:Rieske 2Fe-2S domain-containing protein [Pokkaliibacter sp. MBI-7]MDH2435538.1 Rieske 2Fe-2S domain-containing protein [Pokkaliibacter sp. MBI-7]